jgi:hypothetical protein
MDGGVRATQKAKAEDWGEEIRKAKHLDLLTPSPYSSLGWSVAKVVGCG